MLSLTALFSAAAAAPPSGADAGRLLARLQHRAQNDCWSALAPEDGRSMGVYEACVTDAMRAAGGQLGQG